MHSWWCCCFYLYLHRNTRTILPSHRIFVRVMMQSSCSMTSQKVIFTQRTKQTELVAVPFYYYRSQSLGIDFPPLNHMRTKSSSAACFSSSWSCGCYGNPSKSSRENGYTKNDVKNSGSTGDVWGGQITITMGKKKSSAAAHSLLWRSKGI